ncbi:LysR family transcriptional regulator [Bordetella sp. BOR01]|uniref:LysR family transcriptional regulator n=1 Tax=Bordetella sp. BOR01 TaxID=2854779 RepID=UPI001C44A2A4|nr:LysR family transcriptional regulator [Bordetella sp. BOR01]MBV7486903.1 LysR family transcriptional regulator [Bordetella sp. BOR01]
MKIESFRTLNAVLRGGSFAAAAADMNLSPSAVSLQMKQMEQYFGQPLFDRSALQARPNALAAEVDAVLCEALSKLDALRRRNSPAVAGMVRLGTIEPLQVTLLPPLLRWVREHHPLLDVRLVRGRVTDLVEKLKTGEIDAAIIVQPESGGSRRLSWTPLFREPLVAIAPPDATGETLAELLHRYEWIRFDKSTVGGRLAARYVARHAPHARCRIDLQSLAALTALVSEGLGVSVLPDPGQHVYAVHPVRVLLLGRHGPARQVSFVCRQPDQENRLVLALLSGARAAHARRQA